MAFRLCLLLLAAWPAFAAEVAGIRIEEKETLANSELTLNGAGLRKRVAIHMLRDVDAEQFVDALRSGMADNLPEAEMGDRPVQADLKKALLGEKQ